MEGAMPGQGRLRRLGDGRYRLERWERSTRCWAWVGDFESREAALEAAADPWHRVS